MINDEALCRSFAEIERMIKAGTWDMDGYERKKLEHQGYYGGDTSMAHESIFMYHPILNARPK